MPEVHYTLGTLTYNTGSQTFDFSGNLFRLIPHSSAEPLATHYSVGGGRWNPPNAFQAMYTFADTTTARHYMAAREVEAAFSWLEVTPEQQPDLLVLDWTISELTDLATDAGLAVYNLPTTYPIGFTGMVSWARTQPIGAAIHNTASTGLVTRSASVTDFSGPEITWAELALFPERIPSPTVVQRVAFDDWYT
jgi:RES domain